MQYSYTLQHWQAATTVMFASVTNYHVATQLILSPVNWHLIRGPGWNSGWLAFWLSCVLCFDCLWITGCTERTFLQ